MMHSSLALALAVSVQIYEVDARSTVYYEASTFQSEAYASEVFMSVVSTNVDVVHLHRTCSVSGLILRVRCIGRDA